MTHSMSEKRNKQKIDWNKYRLLKNLQPKP